jgi:hypothetical protein
MNHVNFPDSAGLALASDMQEQINFLRYQKLQKSVAEDKQRVLKEDAEYEAERHKREAEGKPAYEEGKPRFVKRRAPKQPLTHNNYPSELRNLKTSSANEYKEPKSSFQERLRLKKRNG